jgi:hypothetical protein
MRWIVDLFSSWVVVLKKCCKDLLLGCLQNGEPVDQYSCATYFASAWARGGPFGGVVGLSIPFARLAASGVAGRVGRGRVAELEREPPNLRGEASDRRAVRARAIGNVSRVAVWVWPCRAEQRARAHHTRRGGAVCCAWGGGGACGRAASLSLFRSLGVGLVRQIGPGEIELSCSCLRGRVRNYTQAESLKWAAKIWGWVARSTEA